MNAYKQRLMRKGKEGDESSLQCEHGFVPRKGKSARRERDCVSDCANETACANEQRRAYWKDSKK